MSNDEAKVRVRMPRELYERIKEAAEANHRSINKEIVWLLEQALTQRGTP